jgi:hypothetical protein
MQDVSLMSRAELVCALITSTTMTAKAAVTYAKTRDPAVTGNRADELLTQNPTREWRPFKTAASKVAAPPYFDEFAIAAVLGSTRFDGSDGRSRVAPPAESIGLSLSHVRHERGPETREAGAAGAAHARIDDAKRSAVEQPLGQRL